MPGEDMVVNPAYKGISLPVNQWPLLSTYESTAFDNGPGDAACLANSPEPFYSLVAAPLANLEDVSEAMQFEEPNSTVTCASNTSQTVNSMVAGSRQQAGSYFMLGITPLADDQRYNLQTAALQTTSGSFVVPSNTSLAAVAPLLKPDNTTGTWPIPYSTFQTSAGASAYPGTMIVYAAVPTSGLSPTDAADYASLLKFAVSTGQTPGTGVGQLPPGYLPLTQADGLGALANYTLAAAADIAAQNGQIPPVTPSAPGGSASISSTTTTSSPGTTASSSPGTSPNQPSGDDDPAVGVVGEQPLRQPGLLQGRQQPVGAPVHGPRGGRQEEEVGNGAADRPVARPDARRRTVDGGAQGRVLRRPDLDPGAAGDAVRPGNVSVGSPTRPMVIDVASAPDEEAESTGSSGEPEPTTEPRTGPPVPGRLAITLAVVMVLSVAVAFFGVFAFGLSGLQEQRSQHQLYAKFRGLIAPAAEVRATDRRHHRRRHSGGVAQCAAGRAPRCDGRRGHVVRRPVGRAGTSGEHPPARPARPVRPGRQELDGRCAVQRDHTGWRRATSSRSGRARVSSTSPSWVGCCPDGDSRRSRRPRGC